MIEGSGCEGGAGKESRSEDSIAALFAGGGGWSVSESELAEEWLMSIEKETFFLCLLSVVPDERLENDDEAEIVRLWIGGTVSSVGELASEERAELAGEENTESTDDRTLEAMEAVEAWEEWKETLSMLDCA